MLISPLPGDQQGPWSSEPGLPCGWLCCAGRDMPPPGRAEDAPLPRPPDGFVKSCPLLPFPGGHRRQGCAEPGQRGPAPARQQPPAGGQPRLQRGEEGNRGADCGGRPAGAGPGRGVSVLTAVTWGTCGTEARSGLPRRLCRAARWVGVRLIVTPGHSERSLCHWGTVPLVKPETGPLTEFADRRDTVF